MKVCELYLKIMESISFYQNNIDLDINDYAVVETEKGDQYGKVVFVEERDKQTFKNVYEKQLKDEDVFLKI